MGGWQVPYRVRGKLLMGRSLLSKQTRTAFRELLVGYVLREIADFFDGAGVPLGELPEHLTISGQRRTLVEEYYAGVDWTSWGDVRAVLRAYEAILLDLSSRAEDPFQPSEEAASEVAKLTRLLRRDGVVWENDRLKLEHDRAILSLAQESEHFDGAALGEHLRRIEASVLDDPPLAIGSAKELVETVSKMVLVHYGLETDKKREKLPQLVNRALDCLDLKADKIPKASKAAESSRKVLGSLAGITQGMAEIRNAFGTGHGRATASAIKPRHAMLMVGAAATLTRFMMATYEERLREEAAAT